MTPATKAPPRPRTGTARKGSAAPGSARRAAGRPAVRPHRRVSGPARPAAARAAGARAAGARAATARAVAVPLPSPPLSGIGLRVLSAGRSLQDSTLLDRLVRGRGWILLMGALLFGLVALNVSLLKLNAAAGQSAERAKTLRIENAKLRGKVSRLASGDRLRSAAAEMGLVMPEPKKVHYLTARSGRDGREAARNIRDGTALAMTDDLVTATPEIDSEVAAPTPPQPVTPTPAPVAQTPAPAPTPAPAQGTTGPAGTTGVAGAQTVPPGG